jgi:CheY-like chemotaxis protein
MKAPPILIVEDEPDDLRLITRALGRADVSNPVVTASSVEEAQRHCNGGPVPVLVLLDVYLGARTGLEFLEWLRTQAPPLGRTPVVVFTVSSDGSHRLRAQALGGTLFLGKPVTEQVLADAILAFGLERATVVRGGERRRWLAPRDDDRQARALPGTDGPGGE